MPILFRVNLHQQRWDGSVCATPLQHRDCYQNDDFKSAFCERGDPRCFFVNLFHPMAPSLGLNPRYVPTAEVLAEQRPEPDDLCFFWGASAVEHTEWAVGCWRVASFDQRNGEVVLVADPGSVIRFPYRTIRARDLRQRCRFSTGGDAARLISGEMLPLVLDQLMSAVREELDRCFDAGGDADDLRQALDALTELRPSLPEPVYTKGTGRLTQRIVIPPLQTATAPKPSPPPTPIRVGSNGHTATPPVPISADVAPQESPPAVDGYPAELVADYETALKVSTLVLLAGPSGSGKTYLTRSYADAVGAEYLLVAVRPDWRSNEDLLGFLPAFGGDFVPTAFIQFVARAAAEANTAATEGREPVPFHVCLDEMNLARPEYYLAEVLSKMELDGDDRRLHLYDSLDERGFPRSVALPANLSIVGTVNNDDTTHPFSAKVLDRAVYLVCDHVDLRGWFASRPKILDGLERILVELDGILRPTGARVGYRVADQVHQWVGHAIGQGRDGLDALDAAICTLILAKVRLYRSEPRHVDAVGALRNYLRSLGDPADEPMTRSLREVARLEETLARREVAFGQLET